MFRGGLTFDELLDKATSNLYWNPDWWAISQICEVIRGGEITPNAALLKIKKKITDGDPSVAYCGLLVLKAYVNNCGALIHDEIGTKEYMEQLKDLVKTTPHQKVKLKTQELIRDWGFGFANSLKHIAVNDTMSSMKARRYVIPQLKKSDVMFSADTSFEWIDGRVCNSCGVRFQMAQEKRPCNACLRVFCAQCFNRKLTIPESGTGKAVRDCETCYRRATTTKRLIAILPPQPQQLPMPPIKKPRVNESNSTLLPAKTVIFTDDERGKLVSDVRDMVIKEIKDEMMNTMKETLSDFREEMSREFSKIKISISTLKFTIDDQKLKHVDEMDAINARIKKMEATTRRKIDDVSLNISKNLEELKLQMSDLSLQDTNNVSSTPIMNQCLNELDDNLSDKQNVVVFGIPEPHGGNDEERAQNDQEQVRQIFKEVSFDETMDSIQCQRLGSYSPQLAQPRPLRVLLSSPEKVFLLIESAYRKRKSSTASSILKNTLILPD